VISGQEAFPYLRNVLLAVGYGFILPAVAVLHVRNATVRPSGAILGSLAATAAVTVGIVGSINVDAQPAALFSLGIWWWTIGKMAAQTGTLLPPRFGALTAALGAFAFIAVPLEGFGPALVAVLPRSLADALAQPYFSATHLVVGVWLLTVAGVFANDSQSSRGPAVGSGH